MENPIVDLEKLSEPLTRLVEVISKGVGTLYAPFGTVRQAGAEAKAKIIHAEADVAIAELAERARARIEHREALRQVNIERISVIAANELPSQVPENKPSDDWILQFFDCAQDVGDEDIRKLWGRILAGEVAAPGSFSKRTLQFLKTLDKDEAEKFSQLCSFAQLTKKDSWHFLIYEKPTFQEIFNLLGPGDYIDHFKTIGLLSTEPYRVRFSKLTDIEASYFKKNYHFEGPPAPEQNQRIPIPEFYCSFLYFTSIGQELAKIAEPSEVDGYLDRVSESLLENYNVKIIQELT